MKILVKGTQTPLTYQVKIYYYFGSWRCVVREPFLRSARFFGLIPSRIVYVNPLETGRKAELWDANPTPTDLEHLGDTAVKAYENWKIAWEQPHSLREDK